MTELHQTSAALDLSPARVRRWPAVLTLAIASPLIAELAVGSIPASRAWTLLIFGLIYSAGALIVREAVRRRRRGIGAVLAMGLAYGLVEEGIALTSLTSTTLYPVAGWAPRLGELNTAYALWVLPYHAVFSAAVPIALVELLFPRLRSQPYLRARGLVLWSVIFVLGFASIRISLPAMDPAHVDPVPAVLAAAVLATALVVWALARRPLREKDRPVPTPARLALTAAVAVAGYFALLMPFPGARHSADLPDDWAWLAPVVAVAVLAAGAAWARRRATSAQWTPPHTAALLLGALPAHSALGLLALPLGGIDRIVLLVILAAEVILGLWLVRWAARTAEVAPAPPLGPVRRSVTRSRLITVLLTPVLAVLGWAVAVAAGMTPQATAAGSPQPVGAVAVTGVALFAALAGWGLRELLERWLRAGRLVWYVVGGLVLLISLTGPAGAASGSSVGVLVGLHLVVGASVLLGMRRTRRSGPGTGKKSPMAGSAA